MSSGIGILHGRLSMVGGCSRRHNSLIVAIGMVCSRNDGHGAYLQCERCVRLSEPTSTGVVALAVVGNDCAGATSKPVGN